jgi:hypothetical protein
MADHDGAGDLIGMYLAEIKKMMPFTQQSQVERSIKLLVDVEDLRTRQAKALGQRIARLEDKVHGGS